MATIVVPQPVQKDLKVEIQAEGKTLKQVIVALNEITDQLRKGQTGDAWERVGRKGAFQLTVIEPPAPPKPVEPKPVEPPKPVATQPPVPSQPLVE